MTHHHDSSADSNTQSNDPGSGDAPDPEPRGSGTLRGPIEAVHVRPRVRARTGLRLSTVVLLLVFIAALVLYLEFRPGG